MMPDATAGNPYQRQLAQALRANGVETVFRQPSGAFPMLAAVRRSARVDVLHLHWTHRLVVGNGRVRTALKSLRFLLELGVLRCLGIRIVWTAHNLLEHERRQPGLELWCGRLSVRLYDRVVAHCEAAKATLARAYRMPEKAQNKFVVVPHGHFIGAYPDHLDREEARRRLGLGTDERVFLHFGQLRPYKGLTQLLECFRGLAAPAARLVIAGKPWDGATESMVRAHRREDGRITAHLRFIPDAEVQVYMRAADAVVLPYADVLTSGSAMLAMSFARTVLMPRCGCAQEMLGEDGGLLYDAGRKDGLMQAMRRALHANLEAMGERCRQRAATFGWDSLAARTAQLYRGEEQA
jgi:glycosyltransferase involved in cell wall biosynthesis